MSYAVFGTFCNVTCIHSRVSQQCTTKSGSTVNQNACLIRRIPDFEFSICDGRSHLRLTDLDANTQIEHYHNNGSGYFDSTKQDKQYPETYTYIARLDLNISLYNEVPYAPINTCYVSCEFHSEEAINTNGSCGSYDVFSKGRRPVCHDNSTIVNVDIPVNDPVMIDNVWCNINKGLIYYCTAVFPTNTVNVTYGIINDPISLSPTCTTGPYHIPFKNTAISELLGTSSSVNVSPQQLPPTTGLIVGISASILVLAMLLMILIVLLWICNRKKATRQKRHSEQHDGSHSIQDQSELSASANVYEQIHLSPSTDIIPSAESEAISNMPWEPQTDFHGIYSHIDTVKPNTATQDTEVNTLDDPTYDIVGKENKKESKISYDGLPVSSNSQDCRVINNKASCLVENELKLGGEAIEGMYTVVNKKRKEDEDADAPPVPPHTVEELYTAVAKNSKIKSTEKALQLPLPTLTIEEQYIAAKKDSKDKAKNEEVSPPIPPHTVEELYTAVVKKPKGGAVDKEEVPPAIPPVKRDSKDEAENEEVTPPIPPHTVEELYTTVTRKPRGSAEDEEEAPPIPPYMVDKL